MPFLRDEGPPVSASTIQRARETLPLEYGHKTVNESGREVLLVRVPKAKPDYLHDLADVALYVAEDTIRSCKDILLVGHEKVARLEPQRLRDHIREQRREDAQVVDDARRRLDRTYGQTHLTSPINHQHRALALRIPKGSVADFSPEDVVALRHMLQTTGSRFDDCQYGYIIADRDHERLGRRILLELAGVDAEPPADEPPADEPPADEPPAPEPDALLEDEAEPAAEAVEAPVADGAEDVEEAPLAVSAIAAPAASNEATDDETDADLRALLDARRSPQNSPAPAPAAAATATSAATADVEPEETYEIISRPKPAATAPQPAPAAAATPAAAPARADEPVSAEAAIAALADVEEEETYEIMPGRTPVQAEPAHAPAPTAAAVEPAESEESMAPEETAPAAPARRPASGVTPALSTGAHDVVTEEYEVVSGRKPAPAPEPAPARAPPAAAVAANGAPRSSAAAPAASSASNAPASRPGRGVPPDVSNLGNVRPEESYEIISRPPRKDPEPEAAPKHLPAGVDLAPLNAQAPVPTRTKEYEIIGRAATPAADATVRIPIREGSAPASPFPPTPRAAPPTAPPATSVPTAPLVRPPPDVAAGAALIPGLQKLRAANGALAPVATLAPPQPAAPEAAPAPAPASVPSPAQAPSEPVEAAPSSPTVAPEAAPAPMEVEAPAEPAEPVAPAEPPAPAEQVLAERFRAMGYELVENVRAQNVLFAFAAHKPEGGRRVLARVVDAFDAEAAAGLAPLVEALGAEVCLVVAERVGVGTRVATWGTRLQVFTPDEARALEL